VGKDCRDDLANGLLTNRWHAIRNQFNARVKSINGNSCNRSCAILSVPIYTYVSRIKVRLRTTSENKGRADKTEREGERRVSRLGLWGEGE
jgi:hypothetical protein